MNNEAVCSKGKAQTIEDLLGKLKMFVALLLTNSSTINHTYLFVICVQQKMKLVLYPKKPGRLAIWGKPVELASLFTRKRLTVDEQSHQDVFLLGTSTSSSYLSGI